MLTILMAAYLGGIAAKTPEAISVLSAGHPGIAALEAFGWPVVLVMHLIGLATVESDVETRD